MKNYKIEVQEDAVSFMIDNEEEIREAIKDEDDFHSVDCMQSTFNETVRGRSYTISDAAYVIENCTNEETDSGLWEGQDLTSQLSIMAAYSYGNDVWDECRQRYEGIKDDYDQALENLEDEVNELEEKKEEEGEDFNNEDELRLEAIEDEDDRKELAIEEAWSDFVSNFTEVIEPVTEGSNEEKELIEKWFRLNTQAGYMWGGYPLGESYIDSRCGTGHGMPEIKNYVDFDADIVKKCPHLRGKARHDLLAYFKEKFGYEPEKGKDQIVLELRDACQDLIDWIQKIDGITIDDLIDEMGHPPISEAIDAVKEATKAIKEGK